MAQANFSVRIDEKDKKSFEVFCNETGMNVSVAINMFIKAVLIFLLMIQKIIDSSVILHTVCNI